MEPDKFHSHRKCRIAVDCLKILEVSPSILPYLSVIVLVELKHSESAWYKFFVDNVKILESKMTEFAEYMLASAKYINIGTIHANELPILMFDV